MAARRKDLQCDVVFVSTGVLCAKVASSLNRTRRKSAICVRESGRQAPPNGQGGRWTQNYATYKKSRHTGASIESSIPVGVSAPVTSSRAKTTMLSEFWLATRR